MRDRHMMLLYCTSGYRHYRLVRCSDHRFDLSRTKRKSRESSHGPLRPLSHIRPNKSGIVV